MASLRLGEMLLSEGRIDAAQLQSALAHQRRWGGRLGQAIVQLGFMTEPALLEEVGRHLGVPFVDIGERTIPPHVLALVPERIVRDRHVLPLARLSERPRGPLAVALADPGDLAAVDEIAFASGMEVKPVLVAERDLERAIARHLDGVELPREIGFEARDDAIELEAEDGPVSGGGDGGRGGGAPPTA
jgi:type IV pilus assembly protein PilB